MMARTHKVLDIQKEYAQLVIIRQLIMSANASTLNKGNLGTLPVLTRFINISNYGIRKQ